MQGGQGLGRPQPPEVPAGGERTLSGHLGTGTPSQDSNSVCDLEKIQRFSCMLFFIFRALETCSEFYKRQTSL